MENNNNKIREVEETEIDLLQLAFALKRKLWIILLVGALFAAGAFGITKYLMTPTYTSTSKLLVLTKETTVTSLADLQLGTQLTKDYTVLINSRPVMQKVVDNMDLDMDYKALRSCIAINNPESTRILEISAELPDAKLAKDVVDELAEVSSEYIGRKMEVTPPKIIEEGEVATTKTSPSTKKNVMMGFLLGVVLVCGIIVVFELMNDSIQSEEDVERYLNIPVLAVVPDKDNGKRKNNKKRGGVK